MKFKFINDPVRMIFQAAEELWGDLEFEIQYNHALNTDANEFGVTIFPDDGSTPLIEINPELTVMDQIEIIGHEIAHVKAGKGMGHNEVWEGYFREIHEKFTEINKRESLKFRAEENEGI